MLRESFRWLPSLPHSCSKKVVEESGVRTVRICPGGRHFSLHLRSNVLHRIGPLRQGDLRRRRSDLRRSRMEGLRGEYFDGKAARGLDHHHGDLRRCQRFQWQFGIVDTGGAALAGGKFVEGAQAMVGGSVRASSICAVRPTPRSR